MRILVINIALRPPPARIWLPIGLGYVVSAMQRADFQFDLLDLNAHFQPPEEVEEFLGMHEYDVVAMGTIVTGYKYVKRFSSAIKKSFPDTMIIVGNTVAHSIPKLLLRKTDADIAVMGEADETIIELLKRLQNSRELDDILGIWYRRNGEICSNPPRPIIKDIDQIPIPNWDLFSTEIYIKNLSKSVNEPLPPIPRDQIRPMPINTARGCPYNCTFCYHIFHGEQYRWRSPANIVQEMKYLHDRYGINYFSFHDELTFFSIKQTQAFADVLINSGLQVYWEADCRSGLFSKDEHVEVVRKLKQAGCLKLSYSLESADPAILKWMNKRVGAEAFSRQVQILKRGGIASLTSLVLGYPIETEETIRATIDVCIANGIYPSAGYLLPQPGTPMYDYALEHGYIKDEEAYLLDIGDRQDLYLNMTQIPDEELEMIINRELERCNRELGLNLQEGGLLKTGSYRSPEEQNAK